MHFFFVLKLLDVRAIQPSEDVPVDVSHVIAGDVVAVVGEVRAGTAFAGQVFAATTVR